MSVDDRVASRLDELIEKADQVIATQFQRSGSYSVWVSASAFTAWQSQTLVFLVNLLGRNHVYVQTFSTQVGNSYLSMVQIGKELLKAVREDVAGGFLFRVRTLVAAEVFSDFLEMAAHLIDAGYIHPAASLTGATLENGLKQIATNNNVKVKASDDLSAIDTKCADAEVYSRFVQKKIRVWTDVRNHADHGEFTAYTESDVRDMLRGVTDFLSSHLE